MRVLCVGEMLVDIIVRPGGAGAAPKRHAAGAGDPFFQWR